LTQNNLYQYSFIISLRQVIKALEVSIEPQHDLPKELKYSEISKSIVLVRAGNEYGSGVIIHPDGYVLTNRHVVENSDSATIADTYKANVICKSAGLYDLALLLIKDGQNFPYLPVHKGPLLMGTKEEFYSTGYGMWLILRGSTFWKGYIRKLIHHTDPEGIYRWQFISHSCDTYDGNSGGPIINSKGEIVGLNFQNILLKYENSIGKTQKLLYSKLGFAISHEVFEKIINILFMKNFTKEEKYEVIKNSYAMSYQAKSYL